MTINKHIPRMPTLKAIGPNDDPDGFPLVTFEVDEPWLVQSEGMHASDVADTVSSEKLARMLASSPDMAKALAMFVEAFLDGKDPGRYSVPFSMACAALAKLRGDP